jgi:peptidoglycan/LPS O-acetylase OafA/YrhL
MLARLSRLWVVLIPALLLTLSFDKLGESILHGVGYDGRWEGMLSSGPGTGSNRIDFSVETFFGNVFFLQTMVVPVLGTNGPLWSLANEFWYYLMFPFLAVALHKRSTLSLLPVAIMGIFLGWLSFEILSGFLFWLMGWFASMPGKLPFRVRRWHVFVGTAVFAAALASTKFRGGFIGEMVVAVSTWGLLHILPYAKLNNRLLVRGATGLSDMSYSLYLFHFPFMAFCWFVFIAPNQFQPSVLSYGQFFILMTATLILCFAMWWIFERHTAYVRSILRDRLGVSR